jgi:hypothetical protein
VYSKRSVGGRWRDFHRRVKCCGRDAFSIETWRAENFV